jgi:hypothetical protein
VLRLLGTGVVAADAGSGGAPPAREGPGAAAPTRKAATPQRAHVAHPGAARARGRGRGFRSTGTAHQGNDTGPNTVLLSSQPARTSPEKNSHYCTSPRRYCLRRTWSQCSNYLRRARGRHANATATTTVCGDLCGPPLPRPSPRSPHLRPTVRLPHIGAASGRAGSSRGTRLRATASSVGPASLPALCRRGTAIRSPVRRAGCPAPLTPGAFNPRRPVASRAFLGLVPGTRVTGGRLPGRSAGRRAHPDLCGERGQLCGRRQRRERIADVEGQRREPGVFREELGC